MIVIETKSLSSLFGNPARGDLLQENNAGNLSERWREKCWEEFMMENRKCSFVLSKSRAEYFVDIDDVGKSTRFQNKTYP